MSDWETVSAQLADIKTSIAVIEEKVSDLPNLKKRVGKLETWRTSIVGAFTGIAMYLTYTTKLHQ